MKKNALEIGYMKQVGKLVADCFNHLKTIIKPGITGKELDAAVEALILSRGGRPAFKNYAPMRGVRPFPASICISFNEQVIHGIPSDRAVQDGDLVSIDIGAELNGYYSDSAYTFLVGEVPNEVKELSAITQEALKAAIRVCEPGNYIGDIGKAVESVVKRKYGIVREFCGHSIGKRLHDGISIINYYDPKRKGPKLEAGMTLAIEPMINLGTEKVLVLDDGWTVVTQDGKPSCHWEHSIAVTYDGPVILTDREDFFLD